jgi:hypothetical protein
MSDMFGNSSGAFPTQQSGDPGVVLDNIYQVSPLFLGDLSNYFLQNPFITNINQIPGFQQTTPYVATTVAVEETRSVATYGDMNTVGPSLTALPDGMYMVSYSAAAKISSGTTRARINIGINGALPDDTVTSLAYTSNVSGMVGISATSSVRIQGQTGGNTIKLMYAIGVGGTGTGMWGARNLSAILISGP